MNDKNQASSRLLPSHRSQIRKSDVTKEKNCFLELWKYFTLWTATCKSHIDVDNCSSNSWCFYIMFFVIGSTELCLALHLFFAYAFLPQSEITDTFKSKFYVNPYVFGIGLMIEFLYWLLTRVNLARSYLKNYGKNKSCAAKISIILIQSLLTLFPSDMLLFFGYEGH